MSGKTKPAPSASGGPEGAVPLPPDDLASHDLPIQKIAKSTPLWRIHRIQHGPIFFGPGRGASPAYRFDSASGSFGVLYAGITFEAAFVETLLRNPTRRLVSEREIAVRAVSQLCAERPLRLVRLNGPGLSALGLDNRISTGPYWPCGHWADALYGHPEKVDGIAYHSRHDPEQICLALFEGRMPELAIIDAVELIRRPREIARILERYGKSLMPTE